MSENISQYKQNIILQNKNFLIPHPRHKNEKSDNINANNIKTSKILNKSLVIKNNQNQGNNTHIETVSNNIFDSLINLSKLQNKEKIYSDDDKETNSTEKKLSKAKRDMENVKENIDKLNKRMVNMKNKLEKIEINKSNFENELINLISNKETLEEMYNTEITFIKNGILDNCSEIKVSKEEIQNLNINKFINQIITLIKSMNNDIKEEEINSNNPHFNFLLDKINQIHTNFINQLGKIADEENLIALFYSNLYEIIMDKFEKKYPLNVIKSLINYLVKFNNINEQINKCQNFIEMEYKIQKEKINEEMIELTLALIFYEKHKHDILSLTSKLQDELNEKRKLKENKINENHNFDLYDRDSDIVNPEYIQKQKEIIEYNEKDKKENFDYKKYFNNKKIRTKKQNIIKLGISNINIEKIAEENIIVKKENKNKIHENYLNSGIYLNENKKKVHIKNSMTDKSISGYNNKTNLSHVYNFNTSFVDIKPIKRKIENNKKNIFVLRNIFNLNKPKRKKYNSNVNLSEYKTNSLDKKIEIKSNKANQISKKNNNINNKRIINDLIIKKNINQSKINRFFKNMFQINKTTFPNEESFLSDHKKGYLNDNNRILTFKKSLSGTNTNTSPKKNNKSKNTSMKNIRNKANNSNLILTINNNINFGPNVSYKTYKKIKNINNILTDNLKDININLNNLYKIKNSNKTVPNSNEKGLDSELKTLKQEKMESFCFFKFFKMNGNMKKFNPLNVCSINPEYFDYYECYIAIDFISGCLKISPKINLEKIKFIPLNNKSISLINTFNNSFYIQIKLKDILSVKLEKYSKDIVKVQKILSKYKINTNNKFSINKFINKKEIKEIKLDQNEKIKAALCNFFPFSFSIKNNIKIDLVFINYEQFGAWLNNLNSVVHNNIMLSKIGKLPKNNI